MFAPRYTTGRPVTETTATEYVVTPDPERTATHARFAQVTFTTRHEAVAYANRMLRIHGVPSRIDTYREDDAS